jgi:ParB family transcriptional regulator, chromosome partitioning protein
MSKGTSTSTSTLTRGLLVDVDIYHITHPPSICRFFDCDSLVTKQHIVELSKSIAEQGLLQPIIVRAKKGTDDFEIVAGNRRYEACKILGWRKIICHVLELDDKEAFEVTLIENLQRENLNPVEEAYAFKSYVEGFGWGGISDLASRLGKSVSYVQKRLKILDSPPDLLESIANRTIKPSVVEELTPVKNDNAIHDLVSLITKKQLSSRKVRKLVKEYTGSSSSIYDLTGVEDKIVDIDMRVQHAFDKSIVAIRLATSRLATIIESVEDNWIIYEILMHHKSALNAQVDMLLKEKKKL